MNQKNLSVQDWILIEKILSNGIIKLKNNQYVKLIKVIPINFNLKSNFEKEAILKSYKVFLKTCNFDIQILIQSNKEDLEKNIKNIKDNLKRENKEFLNEIGKKYIDYINEINSVKSSSTKDFYIVISNSKNTNINAKRNINTNVDTNNNLEDLIIEDLNDKFFKIKECLIRCGNTVKSISNKKEAFKILFSFFNTRLFLLQ